MRSIVICAPACSNPSARLPSSRASVRASVASSLLLLRSAWVRSSRNCAAAFSPSVETSSFRTPAGKLDARGDDDMPAFKTRHEFRDLSNGGAVVDVVEDHQPSRIALEPAQDGGDLGRVVARLFLWQVENLEGRQARHTRVERG